MCLKLGLGEDAGAEEAGGVVPEDVFLVFVGDGLVEEFGQGDVGGWGVGVGIVGVPDEVLVSEDVYYGGQGFFIGVGGYEDLSLEKLGGG